jgi:hypothetical protein
MQRAIGISTHTGWAACVVIDAASSRPQVIANEVIDVLGDDERFCFHMAAAMKLAQAETWLERLRTKATANARRALTPLLAHDVTVCAIVAKDGEPAPLAETFASHPRIHTAEGLFYRDVFRDACAVPTRIVAPRTLQIGNIGKLAPPPWGRDQKLATAAAWKSLRE